MDITTTRVTGLTGLNVRALAEIETGRAAAATVVEFAGTPAEALARVTTGRQDSSDGSVRRSLAAVIRKLTAGETSPYVRVVVAEALPACDGARDLCGAGPGEPCAPGCPSLATDAAGPAVVEEQDTGK